MRGTDGRQWNSLGPSATIGNIVATLGRGRTGVWLAPNEAVTLTLSLCRGDKLSVRKPKQEWGDQVYITLFFTRLEPLGRETYLPTNNLNLNFTHQCAFWFCDMHHHHNSIRHACAYIFFT